MAAGKRNKKAVYGTTMHDDEKRRAKICITCAIILVICGVLDVFFLLQILSMT